ncbi:autotransporter domain-containing protein [Erwinia sp. MMLR14_017]|uniref:autotransporter domain-containing protein n=1 Tax=Erwinia sp. MMLR14_017 TaxID=3093842 RepID=UPI00298FC943|nr:autotransporter domain-containing protein [Erwinia sp. MMLR14_017]MDW8847253.1 autotransporter domain-containing protein [Erwinia sp. MMLR14_017]
MRHPLICRQLLGGLVTTLLSVFFVPSALALSNGCAAVNALSGSASLSFSTNKYPGTDFAAGDTLSLSFTDSGAAAGGNVMTSDSVGISDYNQTSFQTYNAANSASSSPHTVTLSVASGSLETNGLRLRATTSNGQISNLVFSCTSLAVSSGDSTLSGLSLSSGTLSPSFSAGNSSYSASVANSTASVTVTPVVSESHATVTVNGNAVTSGSASQSISLTAGSPASISVVVTAQDGSARSYTLSVTRAEAPPITSDSSATVGGNSANNNIPLSLSGSPATTVTLVTPPAHGSATVSGTTMLYTPAAGYSGNDSFTWNAAGSGGTSANATVSLTVSAPVLVVTPGSGGLPAATTGSLWSQNLSASGGAVPYSWSAGTLPSGIMLNAATGTLSGTPLAAGNTTFLITVTDAHGATGSASYTLTVNAAPPVASDSLATVSANSASNVIAIILSGGPASSVSIVTPAAHGSATASGTSISYTPTAGFSGSDTFSYVATNSSGSSTRAQVSLTVTSSLLAFSPQGGALPASTTGSNWSQTVTAAGGTAPYAYTATALPQGITLDRGTGRLSGTPAAAGNYTFQITATDSLGAGGTVSYTLSIGVAAQNTLAMLPGSGALPQGKAGQPYAQAFSITGGLAPYTWQISGALPAGLVFADGQLSGIPRSAGSNTFSVTATDAAGSVLRTGYTLVVTAAEAVAADHSVSLYAGQSVTVSLSDGASGGPFAGARLLDTPPDGLGTAAVHTAGTDFQMQFTAAAQASGTLVLRYVLSGPAGDTAPGQVTVAIATRPNPAHDADVIGMVSAEYQAAQNFARAQLRNFSDRLEQLHRGDNLPSDMSGIRFSLPSADPERDADRKLWTTAMQQQKSSLNTDRSGMPNSSPLPFSGKGQPGRLSYWTGGFVDFGGDHAEGVQFSHTTVGISTGTDYRFTPAFTAGLGLGLGRDVSDIGDSGTRTNGRAFSSALYGSYHPGASFVDGLLGYGLMDFDSKRVVSETGAEARGSRSGHQMFSSLTAGYEFRSPGNLISPYARLQYYRTWLDGFSETGAGAFSLAFAPQTSAHVDTAAGLRGEHAVPARWGVLRLQGRLEYAQTLSDSGNAHVGYADTGNDTWRVPLYEQSRETITAGAGIDFLLPDGITPGIAYQGTLGLDAQRTREQMVMVRVNIGF